VGLLYVALDERKSVLLPGPEGKVLLVSMGWKLIKQCLRFANGGVGNNANLCQKENSGCPQLSLEYNRYTVPPGTERIIGV